MLGYQRHGSSAAARVRVPVPDPIRTGYTVAQTLLKLRREHRTVA